MHERERRSSRDPGGDGGGEIGGDGMVPGKVSAAAMHGVSGPAGALPHQAAIQASFGHHRVDGIGAHQDQAARSGAGQMGALAFAYGDQVAFAEAPSLHLAAHEAAHVVQQRGGVQLAGGVGAAGDQYEQHADAVADQVVAGGSAEALLDRYAGGGGAGGAASAGGASAGGAAGAVQHALKNTHAVSPEAKAAVDEQLAPPPGSSRVPDIDGYVRAARAMLDGVIRGSYQKSQQSLQQSSPVPKAEVTGVAQEAQGMVQRVFGALTAVASRSEPEHQHFGSYKLEEHLSDAQALSTQEPVVKDYLRNIMTLITTSDGNPLVAQYNVDLSRSDNAGPFYQLLDTVYEKYSRELQVIHQAAPGQQDPDSGQVYLPMRVQKGLEGNWYFESVQTLVHEYLHVATHPQYRAVANRLPETAQKILIEGFCDYFAMQVWERESQGQGPPWLNPYAQVTQAQAIVAIVGEDNARAAYFLGHTEFLGLGTWTATSPGGRGTHHVLPNDTPASIAAQHGITLEALHGANPQATPEEWAQFSVTAALSTYVPGTLQVRIPGPDYRAVPPPASFESVAGPRVMDHGTHAESNADLDMV